MQRITELVVCDYCAKDITFTGEQREDRLRLLSEPIPPVKGFIPQMGNNTLPILLEDAHFCSIKCLTAWAHNYLKG